MTMDIYSRQLTQLWDADVIVVGAGSAGATAAISAARSGARTVLVERYGFLGGTSTQVLDTFYGFYTPGSTPYKVVGGIPDDVVAELKRYNAAFERPNSYGAGTGVTYDPTMLKIVWETLALQAGVQLLLHSFCTDVIMDGDRIAGIIVDGKRGLLKLTARVDHRLHGRRRCLPSGRRPLRAGRRYRPGADFDHHLPHGQRRYRPCQGVWQAGLGPGHGGSGGERALHVATP